MVILCKNRYFTSVKSGNTDNRVSIPENIELFCPVADPGFPRAGGGANLLFEQFVLKNSSK